MSADYYLSVLESVADAIEGILALEERTSNHNIRITRIVRDTLTNLNMSPSYRDQFVARSRIMVTDDLDEEECNRIDEIARRMTTSFYYLFRSEGFNDEAIALMGSSFAIELEV